MAAELFDIGDGLAVNVNPGGRFHGWLFRRHPDGQYVSVRKLNTITPNDPLFLHVSPKPDSCEHDFTGWRQFADGNGGEQVCAKCGVGALAHTLRTGF